MNGQLHNYILYSEIQWNRRGTMSATATVKKMKALRVVVH